MKWPWYVSLYGSYFGIAVTILMILSNHDERARTANEKLGTRLLSLAWLIFWAWFLWNNAPWD